MLKLLGREACELPQLAHQQAGLLVVACLCLDVQVLRTVDGATSEAVIVEGSLYHRLDELGGRVEGEGITYRPGHRLTELGPGVLVTQGPDHALGDGTEQHANLERLGDPPMVLTKPEVPVGVFIPVRQPFIALIVPVVGQ
ncbi:hypothetical protein D3C75_315930 [compost metagenome]